MFDRKGRVLLAVFLVLALAIPAVGVFASSGSRGVAAAEPAAGELSWTLVHQLPAGQSYYGIYFPTKDVGYAVSGPDWNNASNGSGAPTYISKTTDGGKTWTSKPIPNTDGWMRGITCTDANNCWIAGKVKGRILYTKDGGATWTAMKNSSGYPNWLWSINVTGQGSTVLAGTTCYDPNDAGAKANWLRSTDGVTFTGIVARPNVLTCWVQWDIECPTPGLCYSTGKDYVWRSTNNGASWAGYFVAQTRQYGLSCTSASTCWMVGKSPHIRSTTNDGRSWTANNVAGMPTAGQFWDVAMLNDQVGYAVGCDNTQSVPNTDKCLGKGIMLKTTDGMNWSPIASPSTADLMDIWAFSADNVFVVDFSGKIWHGTGAPEPTPTPTATATPDTGAVIGVAFNDVNGDAFPDENEPGLEGATLLIRRGRTEVATVVSGKDGAFRFDGIAPGRYTVECKQPPTGFGSSSFRGTFRIGANQAIEVFMAYEVADAETPTPTPTATATMQPSAGSTPGYLPVITQ